MTLLNLISIGILVTIITVIAIVARKIHRKLKDADGLGPVNELGPNETGRHSDKGDIVNDL
jgi:hypothetical protein